MKSWLAKKNLSLPDLKTIVLTLLLIGSLVVVGWISVDHFLIIQQSQDSYQTILDLERQVSQLRRQYQEAHPESLQADLTQADQRLIQDFTQLADWAQKIQEHGNQLALHTDYKILKEKQSASSLQGINRVPIEFIVSPRNEASGYGSYLKFLKALEQSRARIDLEEITMIGDGEKATQLTVGLSVWMKTQHSVEL